MKMAAISGFILIPKQSVAAYKFFIPDGLHLPSFSFQE
jgi:hypothetical protein